MKRKIDKYLLEWKEERSRKVVLLRGARQIGKTYVVRTLGKTFKYFLEINFEEEKDLRSVFQSSLNPQNICEKLSAFFSVLIISGRNTFIL